MKTINIVLTDKTHKVLKTLTEQKKKNQSDVINEILENTEHVK